MNSANITSTGNIQWVIDDSIASSSTNINLANDFMTNAITASTGGTTFSNAGSFMVVQHQSPAMIMGNMKVDPDTECKIELPDGAILEIGKKGYKIKDKNAKVVYKACRVREFNRFINASDLMEDFIRFLGKFGVRQNEVLRIPIEVFINWLIYRSTVEDGLDAQKEEAKINRQAKALNYNYKEDISRQCRCCGRFVAKMSFQLGFLFCNYKCAKKFELTYLKAG